MLKKEIAEMLDYLEYIPDPTIRMNALRLFLQATSERIARMFPYKVDTDKQKLATAMLDGDKVLTANTSDEGITGLEALELDGVKKERPVFAEDKVIIDEKVVDLPNPELYIKFSKAEIEKLPIIIKKLVLIDKKAIGVSNYKNGFRVRFRRKGYNIEILGRNIEELKEKFLERLEQEEHIKQKHKYPVLNVYIDEWIKVKEKTVKDTTFKSYMSLIQMDIRPAFGHRFVDSIARMELQEWLFTFIDKNQHRKAEKLKQIICSLFTLIVDDHPTMKNPTTKLKTVYHEQRKGRAFTKLEEQTIIEFCENNPKYAANSALLLLMYTGMRFGELASVEYDANYIYCKSEKTRFGHSDVIRNIPISPMLRRVLHMIDFEKAKNVTNSAARENLLRIFHRRHLHEFRYTFITRAKECGCNHEAVMLWVGHTSDSDVATSKVNRGYTTYSEEYLLNEMKKYDYSYDDMPTESQTDIEE